MSIKRIIPCLDVKDGRVVKGTNFVDLKDTGDPVELAQKYERENADELVLLDITASSEMRRAMYDVVKKTAAEIVMPLTVGGGIRTPEDMRDMLESGADKISVNTAAVNNPQLIAEGARLFGRQCVVLAVDAKQTGEHRWEVFINGGRTPAGLDVIEWVKRGVDMGAGEILLTSMDADGTKDGYDLPLLRAVADATAVPVVASGGAGKLEHFYDALTLGGADAVLAASVFHYGQLSILAVKKYLQERGVPVRL